MNQQNERGESGAGTMRAHEWLASRGLADLSLYWPTSKPIPQIDYESGEAQPTLVKLMADFARSERQAARKECAEIARREFPKIGSHTSGCIACAQSDAGIEIAAAIERLEDK